MSYRVHECFYSLQGEGVQAGRPAVFCRFSGCNLWDGTEAGRASSPCRHCDTDFVAARVYATAEELAETLRALWPGDPRAHGWCVMTGGEPALQLDTALLAAVHAAGFRIAAETNGSLPLTSGLDWVTVSPKPCTPLAVTHGDECKLLYPLGLDPADFLALDFRHFILQPLDDGRLAANTEAALAYCLAHPAWRLGLQQHKLLHLR